MTRERIRLLVLYGGESAEHDVSCVTAAHVVRAIDPAKYAVTAVGIAENGRWSISGEVAAALEAGPDNIPPRLDPAGGTPYEPSAALAQTTGTTERIVALPLLHGPLGEDGTVQGLMELADVAYVGTGVLGSALGMDKAMAKRVLASAGVPQATAITFDEFERSASLEVRIVDELGLPCFVKPANMGSSVGVSKVHSPEELTAAIDLALSYDSWVVAEEAITGREIEVGVLGNEAPLASVAGEIVPGDEFYSYDDKYVTDGAELLVPAPLSEIEMATVRDIAVHVFRTLRCHGLARVDFFFEEGGRGFLCNEVNTMPGFTPISMYPKLWAASGVPYPELIDRLVGLALERHARRRRNTKH
ncbi:MAG: D-alanine--D-alanine ligase [Actinomycetota bacterium]|nr:D-alanine--D-alanine ligase [Actinomycetota bacterium]